MTDSNIKTDQLLLDRLESAAKHVLTKDELYRQRVSFVYGNLPKESTITRLQVEAALAKIEGETKAA